MTESPREWAARRLGIRCVDDSQISGGTHGPAIAQIACTPAVRATRARQGSGHAYAKFLAPDAERNDRLGDTEIEFIRARDGFYQAIVSETGWPYVQFRGGPAGFLKVLDERTIAYANFRGNRQYLSVGNLPGNVRTSLILMDYPNRRP